LCEFISLACRECHSPACEVESSSAASTTRKVLGAVALWLAVAAAVQAGEVAGVKLPESATIEGKTLRLNGMGLRKKVVFKVYVAGLYLEHASKETGVLLQECVLYATLTTIRVMSSCCF